MRLRKEVVFVGLVLGVLVLGDIFAAPDKVVFLDIGQGDSILLQNGTRQVLVDGGPGAKVLQRLNEEMPRLDRRIEVVVLTHPQQDHMEGLLHVLERYEVGLVVLPQAAHTSNLQASWLSMLIERGVPYRFSWYGQRLLVGDMDIKILGPFDTPEGQAAVRQDLNNASTILRVDFTPSSSPPYQGGETLSFLLTGDAELPVERMLVRSVDPVLLEADVLKAGHHGSKSSTSAGLLAAVKPEAVVISVGADNKFGHPTKEVLARLNGERVWRTDEDGSVRFLFDGQQWFIDSAVQDSK